MRLIIGNVEYEYNEENDKLIKIHNRGAKFINEPTFDNFVCARYWEDKTVALCVRDEYSANVLMQILDKQGISWANGVKTSEEGSHFNRRYGKTHYYISGTWSDRSYFTKRGDYLMYGTGGLDTNGSRPRVGLNFIAFQNS